ncbi:hypothetical protein [Sulfitobacter aestuariivivens]|uniref:Uncharacterized protein n=1 Tax=Sulfitobacter aestuariivivens TaxID=2766981 RepID=A0A927D5R0_9RHOB|nr:hypothetical protein [Sulfitobacter aestuariivivens]MBD3664881.1 hypothetical protein [Sulfitobacter aestuariivivens]
MKKHVFAAILAFAGPALADAPVIENVAVNKSGDIWRFDVTLSHKDTGWEDYADGWRVLDPEGRELGVRKLAHPHVEEQPFTRSLSGVRIPQDVTEVGIQASDSRGGWSSPITRIKLR